MTKIGELEVAQATLSERVARLTADGELVIMKSHIPVAKLVATTPSAAPSFFRFSLDRDCRGFELNCNLHTIVRLPNGVFNPYTGIRTNLLFFTKGAPTTHVWYYEHPYPPGAKSYNKGKPIRI